MENQQFMEWFKVEYYAGTYSGIREVQAEDEEHAIAMVRAWVRKNMSLSMYADGYKIIES